MTLSAEDVPTDPGAPADQYLAAALGDVPSCADSPEKPLPISARCMACLFLSPAVAGRRNTRPPSAGTGTCTGLPTEPAVYTWGLVGTGPGELSVVRETTTKP